jgi:hypothetical protein
MLLLLLYSVRKRVRWLARFGETRHWFRTHMMLGIVGPVLILYHCNFDLGDLNSKVALYCTLLVAGSGVLGRYLYADPSRPVWQQGTGRTWLGLKSVSRCERDPAHPRSRGA